MQETKDAGSIPGLGRSPGGGHGNPLQDSLENPMDGGAWQATVHSVSKIQTRLKQLSMHLFCDIFVFLILFFNSPGFFICFAKGEEGISF